MKARLAQLLALALALALAACAEDPPPVVVVVAPPPPAPPVEDALVATDARALPKAFAVDGSLAEWGSLNAPTPPPPRADPKKPKPPPGPPPPKPASRVVVGLDATRFAIAAELRKDARDGAWVAIAFDVGELGPLGTFQRGGGVNNAECAFGLKDKGEAAIKACVDELEQRSKAYQRTFAARFQHTYRVDRSGVRLQRGDQLVAIEGAKFVAKDVGDAVVIEAELPLTALPRVGTSPIGGMSVAARPAHGDSTFVERELVGADIEPAVALVGESELRTRIYDEERGRGIRINVFHYQPGERSSISVTGYGDDGSDGASFDAHRYEERDHALFSPQRTFGDVEVGYVFPRGVATKRGGKLVAVEAPPGKPLALVERDGRLHAFFWYRSISSDDWLEGGQWSVVAIARDGAITEVPVDPIPDDKRYARIVDTSHDPDFATLGFRAEPDRNADVAQPRYAFAWKWDGKLRRYRLSTTVSKISAKKKR